MDDGDMEKVIIDATQKGIAEFLKGALTKVNLFTSLQILWLLEIYYLMSNSLINIINKLKMSGQEISVNDIIPSRALELNKLILQYFRQWNNFVFLLCIILFISGFIISITKVIPGISNYNLILKYSDYGIYASGWLILIYATYKLFVISDFIFCSAIPIIAAFFSAYYKIKRKLFGIRW